MSKASLTSLIENCKPPREGKTARPSRLLTKSIGSPNGIASAFITGKSPSDHKGHFKANLSLGEILVRIMREHCTFHYSGFGDGNQAVG